MLIRPLFEKYQKQLIAFANTQIGRAYLDIKTDNRIVKIAPDGFHEYLGTENGRDYFKATLFPRSPLLNKFELALMGMALVEENFEKLKFNNLLDFDHAFVIPHYLGINPVGFLPKINFAVATLNPDAHPESTTVDGRVYRTASNESWSTIRTSAGTTAEDSNTTAAMPSIDGGTTNTYVFMARGILLFDRSSINAAANIDAAVLSGYVTTVADNHALSVNVSSCTPASNTALAASDYNIASMGSTKFASDVDLTSYSTSAYNALTFVSAGKTYIQGISDILKFALRWAQDISDTTPTWNADVSYAITNTADNGSNKPKLEITYSLGSGNVMMFQGGGLALA